MINDFFDNGYPPPAFYFSVTIGNGIQVPDTSFSEVSGIGTEIETESVVEGGENRFVHQLPLKMKHGNLELKRGIATLQSPLVVWCKAVLEGEFMKLIVPQTIIVNLKSNKMVPGAPPVATEVLRTWEFFGAYPIKWDVESFSSTKNDVAIEKITFSYTYSQRTK
ncbi:phage tail protein [Undibacterium sp. Di26W]|uniref:phage tail protein n=1 Tax=Undibacterium sp. Di26W TaxID=3413035 RepID=UPI003BF22D51